MERGANSLGQTIMRKNKCESCGLIGAGKKGPRE